MTKEAYEVFEIHIKGFVRKDANVTVDISVRGMSKSLINHIEKVCSDCDLLNKLADGVIPSIAKDMEARGTLQ